LVDFTDRYFHTAARFAGPREGIKLEITPDGLEGRRIGVVKGKTAALIRHPGALEEDCRLADIVIAPSPSARNAGPRA